MPGWIGMYMGASTTTCVMREVGLWLTKRWRGGCIRLIVVNVGL